VLLGVAIGDALGAPVEFLSLESILAKYGPDGVTDLEPWDSHPAGSYTDDTQMTIATALGTLAAVRAGAFGSSDEAAPYVWRAYLDWYETQNDPANRRGPGTTCMSALAGGVMGTALKLMDAQLALRSAQASIGQSGPPRHPSPWLAA